MNRAARSLSVAFPIAFAASCASAPPPEENPLTPTASATTSAAVAKPTYDLSPVSAPANVVLQGHAKSLAATFQTLGISADQVVRGMLHETLGKGGLRLDVDPDKVSALVATEAPLDVVVALPDSGADPLIAVAVGLRSIDDAKTALNANQELAPGMWSFGGEKAKAVCVVAASTGLVQGRMICGPGERDIKALGPWLARGASSLPNVTDASFDIDLKPVEAKFGPDIRRALPLAPRFVVGQWGIGDKQFDKALEVAAGALANEGVALLSDFDTAHLDLTLSQDKGISLNGQMTFKGKTSWIATTAARSENKVPPAMFFRAPADSAGVTFSNFKDPADYEGMKKVAKDAIEGFLASKNIGTDAERKKISALVDFPMVKDMTLVSASGYGHVSKVATPKTDQEKFDAFFDSQTGWRLLGTNVKADVVSKWLKDAVTAYNQPGVQKEIADLQKKGEPLPIVKTPAAPAKLGKGAFEVDVALKVSPEKNAPMLTVYALVMADGDESWLAIGANKDELVERLLMVKNGAPKDKTIDGRADLQAMKTDKAVSSGFLTLDSFRSVGTTIFMRMPAPSSKSPWDDLLKTSDRIDQMVGSLPHKAQTPMMFEATLATTEPLVSKFTFNVPKGTIDDIAAVINLAGK